eukprot:7390165-Prymnesium_polylepis.1
MRNADHAAAPSAHTPQPMRCPRASTQSASARRRQGRSDRTHPAGSARSSSPARFVNRFPTLNCELGGKSTSSSLGMAEKWRMSLVVMESMTKIDPESLRPGS